MIRRKTDRRHPRPPVRAVVDPLDRLINGNRGPEASRPKVGGRGLLDRAVRVVVDQRRDVVAAERFKIQVAWARRLTDLFRIEDAALIPTGASGRNRATARERVTRAVRHVAGARIRAVGARAGYEAAGVGFSGCGDAAGGFVDRGWIARLVQPAGKVVPAQVMGHRVAGRIMTLKSEVELAEQGAIVSPLRQQLRRRHFVGRDHRVGQVGRAERSQDVGAKRKAAIEKHRPAGRARRHRPGVAEADPGAGDLSDVRRTRRRLSAVAKDLHLVNAHIIHNDEQNVRPGAGCCVRVVCAPPRPRQSQQADPYHHCYLHRCPLFH